MTNRKDQLADADNYSTGSDNAVMQVHRVHANYAPDTAIMQINK
jgi:hypothetical protein